MLNVPQTKELSPALVIIILETICYTTALLSVALRESRLGVLFVYGYSFKKQSEESCRHSGRRKGVGYNLGHLAVSTPGWERVSMSNGKPYKPPRFIRYESEADYPEWAREAVKLMREEFSANSSSLCEVKPEFVTVVDSDRRFVQVSDSFCHLLGYRREELIGKPYDDVTAPNTNDIQTVFNLFAKLGYMHGLWMLASRRGTHVLVRYESWIRPDSYIEVHMEAVGAGCSSLLDFSG
jgi:PAS domain S-box-containing protein